MNWVSRERPHSERLACSWLIRRFIDGEAAFRFLPVRDALSEARRIGAIAFDVPGAELRPIGAASCFDSFLARYRLHDQPLRLLAVIVRNAFAPQRRRAPQSDGLLAISCGLTTLAANDEEILRRGFVIYDALYQWCSRAPPDPEFALEPMPLWPAIGWREGVRRAIRQHHGPLREARVLASLTRATIREVARERAADER